MTQLGVRQYDFNKGYIAAHDFKFIYLKNSSGEIDMNVDAGTTPQVFSYAVPVDKRFLLVHVIAVIVDGGIGFGSFAGLTSALSTGIEFGIYRNGVQELDFTGGVNIKTNEDLMILTEGSIITPAAGDDALHFVFELARDAADHPALLMQGDSIKVTLNDDLSDLSSFRFLIHGLSYDNPLSRTQNW